jgi:hypothetical protein
VRDLAVGSRDVDQHCQKLDAELAIGELPQAACVSLHLDRRDLDDVLPECIRYRVDAGRGHAMYPGELGPDAVLFGDGVVAIGIRDRAEKARHARDDTDRFFVRVRKVGPYGCAYLFGAFDDRRFPSRSEPTAEHAGRVEYHSVRR